MFSGNGVTGKYRRVLCILIHSVSLADLALARRTEVVMWWWYHKRCNQPRRLREKIG